MPVGALSTADYAAVIKDLRAKCAEMQRTIAFLDVVSGIGMAHQESAHPPAWTLAGAHTEQTAALTSRQTRPTTACDHTWKGACCLSGAGERISRDRAKFCHLCRALWCLHREFPMSRIWYLALPAASGPALIGAHSLAMAWLPFEYWGLAVMSLLVTVTVFVGLTVGPLLRDCATGARQSASAQLPQRSHSA